MNEEEKKTSQFESISHFDLSDAVVFFDNSVFAFVIGATTADWLTWVRSAVQYTRFPRMHFTD